MTCKRIDSSLRKFWWGYKQDSTHKLSLHSWSKICAPKAQGEMGLKPTHEINFALLSKMGWLLSSSFTHPWATYLHAKYLRNTEFMHADQPSSSSWI